MQAIYFAIDFFFSVLKKITQKDIKSRDVFIMEYKRVLNNKQKLLGKFFQECL